MADEFFDDEILTDVLDGTADPKTVAAVQASAAASARLDALRRVTEVVGATPSPATAERRAQSIAAALAAARVAPQVTSLSVARQQKVMRESWYRRPELLAVAAAVVVVLLTLPFLASIGGDDADTASTAGSATDAVSTDDAGNSFGAGDDDAADDGDAMAEAPALAEAAPATTTAAMADAADRASEDTEDDTAASDTDDGSGEIDGDAPFAPTEVSTLADLDEKIGLGLIEPRVTLVELEESGLVLPECADAIRAELGQFDESVPVFDAVIVIDAETEAGTVVVYFAPDETTRLFDAEDCSTIR